MCHLTLWCIAGYVSCSSIFCDRRLFLSSRIDSHNVRRFQYQTTFYPAYFMCALGCRNKICICICSAVWPHIFLRVFAVLTLFSRNVWWMSVKLHIFYPDLLQTNFQTREFETLSFWMIFTTICIYRPNTEIWQCFPKLFVPTLYYYVADKLAVKPTIIRNFC